MISMFFENTATALGMLSILSVLVVPVVFVYRRYRVSWEKEAEDGKPVFRDLGNPETRKGLEKLLEKASITGEAIIKDGEVLPRVMPEHLEHLVLVFELAASRIKRMRNPNACSIYLRDSATDRFMVLDELSLLDIQNAALAMRQVAEDRAYPKKEKSE